MLPHQPVKEDVEEVHRAQVFITRGIVDPETIKDPFQMRYDDVRVRLCVGCSCPRAFTATAIGLLSLAQ